MAETIEHQVALARLAAHLNAYAYHKPRSMPSLAKLLGKSKAERSGGGATETSPENARAWIALLGAMNSAAKPK